VAFNQSEKKNSRDRRGVGGEKSTRGGNHVPEGRGPRKKGKGSLPEKTTPSIKECGQGLLRSDKKSKKDGEKKRTKGTGKDGAATGDRRSQIL